MNPQLTLVQNNYGYVIPFILQDAIGSVVNLTIAVLSFVCQSVSDTTVQFTESMVVTNASGGDSNST